MNGRLSEIMASFFGKEISALETALMLKNAFYGETKDETKNETKEENLNETN